MHTIAIITSVHRWDDTRIFHKQATSLAKHYIVELHAPADFKYKVKNNVKIFGLPQWRTVSDRIRIRKKLYQRITKSDAELIHFHDPELLWIGIKIKYILRKKVIYDVHENYPDAILSKTWIPQILKKIISLTFGLFEKIAASKLDGIIYTTELIGERFTGKKNRKIAIYNFPFSPTFKLDQKQKKLDQIVYVGGITRIRGMDELIEAMHIVNLKKNIKLIILGIFQTQKYEDHLKSKIDQLGLGNKIQFKGMVKYEDIFNYISQSAIGIVCYLPVPNHLSTIPNKILEYNSAGTAVISSHFPLYKQVIEENHCGLFVDPTSPEEIANAIIEILSDKNKIFKMGMNGYHAICNKYNWHKQEGSLFSFYEKVLQT